MLGKKLLRKRATLQDIYRLYQVIIRVPKILDVLNDLECVIIKSSICDPIRDALTVSFTYFVCSEWNLIPIFPFFQELHNFKKMVESIIDVDAIERGEFLVKASFDENLTGLKETMDTFESKMAKLRTKASEDLGIDGVKLEYVSHLGWHFRVTMKDETALRNSKKYKTIDALKGGVRFTNDALEKLNSEFLEAKEGYEEQQQEIVTEVIATAVGYLGSFTRLNNSIAELDCLLSFAVAAASAPTPYVKPKMSDESPRVLNLQGMRHPCLELQEDIEFIANDVAFKEDETNMYIITGIFFGKVFLFEIFNGIFNPCRSKYGR